MEHDDEYDGRNSLASALACADLSKQTYIQCQECTEHLHLTQEIFEVRVVQAQLVDGSLQYHDVLDDSGDYAHTPRHFCFDCWENLEEDIASRCEDMPPIQDAFGLIECDLCKSDIREWEVLALVRFGEIHFSKRSPNGTTYTFENMGKDKHICLACVYNDEERLWEEEIEAIPQVSVCSEGIHSRCWRRNCCKERCEDQTPT